MLFFNSRDLTNNEPAFYERALPVMPRSELMVSFDLTFNIGRTADISIVRVADGIGTLSDIRLSPDNTLSVAGFTGELYPSLDIYPSYMLYPTVASYLPYKEALPRLVSGGRVELTIRNPGLFTDVDLYVEEGSRFDFGSYNLLNWKDRPLTKLEIGCTANLGTIYDLSFDNVEVWGDEETEWYNIRDYQGFDTDVRWQAALDTNDPSTYTDFTDLRQLARYDYARPEITPTTAKGIRWTRLNG